MDIIDYIWDVCQKRLKTVRPPVKKFFDMQLGCYYEELRNNYSDHKAAEFIELLTRVLKVMGAKGKETDYLVKVFDLSRENAQLRAERDAIEEEFRQFSRNWWKEDNAFPCRFCKFADGLVCTNEEKRKRGKLCAGGFFEWRGLTNTNEISSNLETDFGSSKSS